MAHTPSSDPQFYRQLLDSIGDGIYFVDLQRKITFWNKGAERITGYLASDVVGSSCKDDILVHVDGDGCSLCKEESCPAFQSMHTGETLSKGEVFLHHKQGQRLSVNVRTSALRDDDGQIIGAVEVFKENMDSNAYQKEIERLQEMALLDPLTHVGNRRFGEIRLESAIREMERYHWSFGLVFVDVDHFKQVNDVWGHDAGDRVLAMVGETLNINTRSFDYVIRWGGEEFLIILANVDLDSAARIGEKLRVLIKNNFLKEGDKKLSVTASMGVTVSQPGDTADSVLKRADALMYLSKQSGRDRVSCDTDIECPES